MGGRLLTGAAGGNRGRGAGAKGPMGICDVSFARCGDEFEGLAF